MRFVSDINKAFVAICLVAIFVVAPVASAYLVHGCCPDGVTSLVAETVADAASECHNEAMDDSRKLQTQGQNETCAQACVQGCVATGITLAAYLNRPAEWAVAAHSFSDHEFLVSFNTGHTTPPPRT